MTAGFVTEEEQPARGQHLISLYRGYKQRPSVVLTNGLVCICALQAYDLRAAGAVMHSHSLNAVMATMLDPQATEFRVTHLEMIKVR